MSPAYKVTGSGAADTFLIVITSEALRQRIPFIDY